MKPRYMIAVQFMRPPSSPTRYRRDGIARCIEVRWFSSRRKAKRVALRLMAKLGAVFAHIIDGNRRWWIVENGVCSRVL